MKVQADVLEGALHREGQAGVMARTRRDLV